MEDLVAAFAQGGPEAPPPPGVEAAGGVAALGPGVSSSVTMNLAAGNYAMVCFIGDQNEVPHFVLVMSRSLTVTAATGSLAAEPQANVTMDMFDFGFSLSAPIPAGQQTIRITNSGPQIHEAVIVQLAPETTIEEFIAALEEPTGPPPGRPIGGLQSISNGGQGFFSGDFAPGNYGLICFEADVETGTPHAFLGMVDEFTV